MTPARFQLRAVGALGLVLVALAALVVRLGTIQTAGHEEWADRATGQQICPTEVLPAERGAVVDRHGRVLARCVDRPSVALDPQMVRLHRETERVVRILNEELGEDVSELLAEARPGRRFAYVRRRITDVDAVKRVRERAAKEQVRGIVVLHESVRSYPADSLAAQVVGFTYEGTDGMTGAEGAEMLADARLRGVPGRRQVERDGRGRKVVLGDHDHDGPVDGADVRLTIDSTLQRYAEQLADDVMAKHAPKSAVIGLMDVRTGDVLAVACRPTFDPNDPAAADPASRRNRFFTDVFEPGSIFKPLVMAAALDAGVVRPGQQIDCNPGTFTIGTRTIREDKHKNLGVLTPAMVLAKSSNVGMAQIGLALGIDRLHDAVRQMGFGRRTGAGWPAESAGMMTPLRKWTPEYTVCSVSFGHEIAVTPAQMLASYAALGNGGWLHAPRIFADAPRAEPVQMIGERGIREVGPMLEEVYRSGTAKRVASREYRLAGKTGTAEKKRGRALVGYVGSFVCYGPAEAPRLAAIVVADEPTGKAYGSIVAAPYATDLLVRGLHHLEVPPSSAREPLDVLEVMPR